MIRRLPAMIRPGKTPATNSFGIEDRVEHAELLHRLGRRLQAEGGDAEDHHRDRGRDDDAEAAGGCGDGGRVAALIAVVDHRRDHQEADRGRRGRAGAGDRAEEETGEHGRGTDAAGKGAGEALGERHQALRNAGGLHQGACEDEGGQGHQREGADRGERDLHELDRVVAEIEEGGQRRDAERHGDRRADQKKDEKGANRM